jgi:cytosine/adenosine deaminase-related metal-dependent hydrolase
MVAVLSSDERKDYKITTADVTLSERKDIVAYMLSQLPNPHMHIAAVFAMGFYLTVELVEWLKPYIQHPDPWISKEAAYAIQFLKERKSARRD